MNLQLTMNAGVDTARRSAKHGTALGKTVLDFEKGLPILSMNGATTVKNIYDQCAGENVGRIGASAPTSCFDVGL